MGAAASNAGRSTVCGTVISVGGVWSRIPGSLDAVELFRKNRAGVLGGCLSSSFLPWLMIALALVTSSG